MKQLRMLVLTGIVTLFTTFTHAAPAINMAPVISYLLSDTQKLSLLELIAGNTLYHHKGGEGDYLGSFTFNADATSVTITIIDGPNSGDSEVVATSVVDDTLFIGDNSLILTEQTSDYLLFETSRFYFDEAAAREYFPTSTLEITEAMIVGKVFYTQNDHGDGSFDFEEISFISSTQVEFREILTDQSGSIFVDSSVNLPYTIVNGNIVMDFSTPGDPSYSIYELISMTSTVWNMTKDGDANSPYATWLLSKPIDFPASDHATLFISDVMPIFVDTDKGDCKSCHTTSSNRTFKVGDATYTHDNILTNSLINTTSPDLSSILIKGNGGSGHQGGDKLSDVNFEIVRDWIVEGGLNN